jgi:hypothetical protein
MKRRDLFRTTAAAATAAALPAGAAAQTAAKAARPAWTPALFDAHQNSTVTALIDLLIPATDTPGAKAARVNEHMDRLLADGAPEARESFLLGLNFLDGQALERHSKPFVSCSAAEQAALLESFEAQPGSPGGVFFRQAKALTSRIYYATEIGFQELNKGGRVPKSYASCAQPGSNA